MVETTEPIDPRVDIAFKRIFGSEGHAEVPKSFLNAIFKVAGLPAVRELSIQNPFRYAEFRGEKDIELDILYVDEAGRQVQLEMQVARHAGLEQRMLHNWGQLYLRQIDKGGSYHEHRPVVCLWVLERPLWPDDDEWLHLMRIRCERSERLFHQDLCIITVELATWRRLILARCGDSIVHEGPEQAWLYFLAEGHALSPERLKAALAEPIFTEAVELMADFNAAKRRRHYYDMRRNYSILMASYRETGYETGLQEGQQRGMLDGFEKGRAKGLEQGIEQGIEQGAQRAKKEAVRKLLGEGVAPETVAKVFDISLDELLCMNDELSADE